MKTCAKNLFLLPALIACLGLILAVRVTAQTFTTLYNFTAVDPDAGTNNDGANPRAGLILLGNTLYGTAYGGSSGAGTVFAVNTNGTSFTTLYAFMSVPGFPSVNDHGANPQAGLILSGNILYGTASYGGGSAVGTVFAVNTDGAGFTNLHSLSGFPRSPPYNNNDGAYPYAGLILSSNILYGTASQGGSSGNGTVFGVNTDGTGFTPLYNFTALDFGTNSDGANPLAGLILSTNTLFGTARNGGSSGNGTVFAVNTDGSGFVTLHNFTSSDGANPAAGLILSGNTLYGTTVLGGNSGSGMVFAVRTDGTGFTNVHSFTATSGPHFYTNSDGAFPNDLILSGNSLYGTTLYGGSAGDGVVFKVNTDGTGFTILHTFTGGGDGASLTAGLILSGNTLYGTASQGGSSGNGTIFSLSLGTLIAPRLTVIRSAENVVLAWPTVAEGFTLQSTTSLVVSPALWSTVSPGPVVVNGQNAVTNPISGAQQFYRLSQ